MAEAIFLVDARKLKKNTLLLIQWYSKNGGGHKTAPAKILSASQEDIRLVAYPYGGGRMKLVLLETRGGRGLADRRGQEYTLCTPNEAEKDSCQRMFKKMETSTSATTVEELTPAQIAERIMRVASVVPHGGKFLAKQAGVEYDAVFMAVIRRLGEYNKLVKAAKPNGKKGWAIPNG